MKKILIVEDEKSLCSAIKLKVEQLGIEAIAVHSAEEAADFLKQGDIDLIWLDLRLPKISGIDFLRSLKNNQDWKDKKVVIVSVSGNDKIKEEAKKLGALDYFVKSEFPLGEIVNQVVKYI